MNMLGNGKLRYYGAESFTVVSFVGHSLDEIFGISRWIGIDKCSKDVFLCAMSGALMGYAIGGTLDFGNYIVNYIMDSAINENKKSNDLEKKVSE